MKKEARRYSSSFLCSAFRGGAVPGLKPPRALEELLAPDADDERVLARARELNDLLGPRVREQVTRSASARSKLN